MKCISRVSLALLLAAAMSPAAWSQTIVASLDTTNLPVNADNGFSGFSFGDFPAIVPAIVSSPTDPYLTLDITDGNAMQGVFGGLGVDFVTSVGDPETNQLTQNFDPNDATWEVRLRIGDNNEATAIRTTLIDVDGAAQDDGGGPMGVSFLDGDEYVYEFDISGVPVDGEFHTLTKSLNDSAFFATGFGLNPGDGVLNPGLKQIQIQTVFDSTGRLDIEVEFARISVIPEPTTMIIALLGLAPAALIRRR